MAKVLKADGSTDAVYAEITLAAGHSDVWVTFRVAFDDAALAYFGTAGGEFANIQSIGADFLDDVDIHDDSGPVWASQLGGGPSPVPTASEWHLAELHHKLGDTCHLYIDGELVVSGPDPNAAVDSRVFRFGLTNVIPDPDAVAYIDNVTIGTTRGADDLFSDDFEDGTLDAWSNTFGDVTVVDDPFPSDVFGVCIAFDDSTLETDPAWTRLDDPDGYQLVQSWSIDRGRSTEMDETKTGTATVQLIDTEGILDPTNPGGPFYGNLDPMKQAKIDLWDPIAETWTTVFRGFVSEWLYEMDVSEKFMHVTLELADAFDLFAALELTPGEHGDDTGLSDFADVWFKGTPSNVPGVANVFRHWDDSVHDTLDAMGWSVVLRDVFSGNIGMQGSVYARRDQGLQVLHDRADAEWAGVAGIYMSKAGLVRGRGRFARFFPERPGYGIGFWECGDTAAAIADSDVAPLHGNLSFRRSKNDLINAALILPQGVDETDVPGALVKDPTSIAKYGWRAISYNDLLVSAGHDDDDNPTTALEECAKVANYYVGNYKDPKTRLTTLRFKLETAMRNAAALCALIVGVEIGDVIQVTTSHPGGGGFDEDGFVEGIRYEAEPRSDDLLDVTLEVDWSPRSFYNENPFGDWDDS